MNDSRRRNQFLVRFTTRAPGTRVRILESVPPPGPTVKYIDQVVRHSPGHIQFFYFSWLTALTRRYDAFHIHWPEVLVRDRTQRSPLLRLLLARVLLARLRWTRTPIIRTVHNHEPHNSLNEQQALFLKKLDRATSVFVHLNSCADDVLGKKTSTIPHGHYRDQFSGYTQMEAVAGRYLVIGRIERYKGVDRFIRTMAESARSGEEARIVGSASPDLLPGLELQLKDWRRDDVTLSTRFEFVSDADLVAEITAAECVVLPYREMLNSGIALVALSLNRPIVVPSMCVNDELSREAGSGWVIQYSGDFDGDVLAKTRRELIAPRSPRPNLENRSWEQVALAYASVFEDAVGHTRARDRDTAIGDSK